MYKKIALLAMVGILSLSSCQKDLIELTPDFTLDAENNPSNMVQIEHVLNGAYAGLRAADYYGSGSGTGSVSALMPDVMSDNLFETNQSLANSRPMSQLVFQINEDQITRFYNAGYKVVSSANIVLQNIDKFATAANAKQVNRIKGQALALRALAHFDMFKYFAEDYDRNSTTTLALNYGKEFKVDVNAKPSRLNNKQFYDELLADLNAAQGFLGDVDNANYYITGLVKPRLSLAAVHLLKARVYLYAKMYPEAIASATAGIAIAPTLVNTQTAFSGMYNQTAAGEIIWNVQFDANQGGPTNLVYFATQTQSYFRPALEIATVAGTTGLIRSTDIRYAAYFANVRQLASNPQALALIKYRGKSALSNANANFIAMKTAELYLIRAEAYAKSSPAQEALAIADLNAVRTARIAGYVPEVLVGSALTDAIANERRREFVGEGHRFFDLKRTTRTLQRGSTCGVPSLSPITNCSLAPTAREWSFPITQTLANANNNLQQNPSWR
ncbi:RagB/SusD family nutrient uptake outer membrane protein [Pedobacter sp. SL55]|uniref:RagB/SusD family nutrient uptake outer membrane protein n=1 Tax=Pedobacter sp. SL55 TaxID=2995161 RepID=UPI00227083E2|nr:RagB/SusD family nutrient uptake outer membrane protein [Pedobacter sp. SL55]WAC41883.1 RagB/SusD family nutrient uptake outer membrane protein [Pedobacter sp. SL55]